MYIVLNLLKMKSNGKVLGLDLEYSGSSNRELVNTTITPRAQIYINLFA
jgi:hypothetical protein